MTSPFGSLAVIVNPHAGRGRVAGQLPALERALTANGLDFALELTHAPGDATRFAREAVQDGCRFLVAVGGDGTIQEVLNGMLDDGPTPLEQPVLGVVAATSGCDLVRSFGLPDDTDGGCKHLAGSNTYPFDVIKIGYRDASGEHRTRYAANLVEIGLGASVARATARLPAGLGNARRFLGFWGAYALTRATSVKVDADMKTFEARAFNVIVANAQFASAGLRMSPRSFPGDGVLDALVFRGPRSDAYRMLPRIYRHGSHVPDPNIHEMRAKIRVAVDADRPLPIVADGELLGTTPATFQVVPQRILLKL
ncbi:MAG: diacylglycerol kinase family protein [Actinomycetota bacterium]